MTGARKGMLLAVGLAVLGIGALAIPNEQPLSGFIHYKGKVAIAVAIVLALVFFPRRRTE